MIAYYYRFIGIVAVIALVFSAADAQNEDRRRNPALPAVKKGMTWCKFSHDNDSGIDQVGCNNGGPVERGCGCNAYIGDVGCDSDLPLLCIKKSMAKQPSYEYENSQFYDGWAGGHIATTLPTHGFILTSRDMADAICTSYFGAGWLMA
jgi:hypothetical protein